jgi:phage tail-like protein
MADYHPPVGFHFRVDFDLPETGGQEIHFQEVTGLSMELEEEIHVEGGENRFSHRLPGRASYPDLVLKRGLLTGSSVFKWCQAAIENLEIEPITVWVILLNEDHEPLQTYTFMNAWPKLWTISDPNAESSAIIVEELTLSYQYFKVS